MSYSTLTEQEIKKVFGVEQVIRHGLFADVPSRSISELLREILAENLDLALQVRTEKARSELIVAPVLVELRRQADRQISVFSGNEFDVDAERGLCGRCDFLISRSSYQRLIEAPVVAAVEAKKDDFDGGLTQCVAEMIAARIFNQREGQPFERIYGAITNGQLWQFVVLRGSVAEVDVNFYEIAEIEKIIGILWAMTFDEVKLPPV
jgi:hypothetical protein